MESNSKIIMGVIAGLAVLTLGCQSLLDIELPTFGQTADAEMSWPHSTFVPPTKRVQIFTGQALELETYHLSPEQLTDIQIFVNGQPLRSEETAGSTAFPDRLLNVQVRSGEDGRLVQTARVTPALPTSEETVSVVVIGNTPGRYDLSLVAADEAGQEGTPIVQRIEVVER